MLNNNFLSPNTNLTGGRSETTLQKGTRLNVNACPLRGFGSSPAPPAAVTACPFGFGSASAKKSDPVTTGINQLLGSFSTDDDFKDFQSIPTPEVFDYEAYRLDQHVYIRRLHEKFGDIIRIPIEGKDMVFVRDPMTVRRVLTSEDEFDKTFADADDKSTSYLQYFKNLVQPLFTSAQIFGSSDNKAHRAGMKQVFLSSKKFLPGFQSVLQRFCADWPTGRVDTLTVLHPLVFNLVMVIMAGEDAEGSEELLAASQDCLNHFVKRYTHPLFDEHVNEADAEFMQIVEEAGMKMTLAFKRKAEKKQLSKMSESSMLGMMLEFGLSDVEMNATMINALFAACEAPIHVLSQALVVLSKKPNLQNRLLSEIRATPDGKESKLLNDVIMECLRLYSPVTLVQRCTIQDVVLDGYKVPKGIVMGVCISAVHHNPKYFANPTEFDPERTKLNMVVLKKENCFMPFSGGPRGCPGRYLAVTILKSSVAHILQNFEVCESANINENKIFKFVEFPVDGAFVSLKPRGQLSKL